MSDDTDLSDDSPAFEKQRRNLLIYSSLLLFFLVGGFPADHVSIAGAEFPLTGTVPIISAWLLWAYFLIRFIQCPREGKDLLLRQLDETIRSRIGTFLIENPDVPESAVNGGFEVVSYIRRHKSQGYAIQIRYIVAEPLFRSQEEVLAPHAIDPRTVGKLIMCAEAPINAIIKQSQREFNLRSHYWFEYWLPYVIAAITPLVGLICLALHFLGHHPARVEAL